MTTVSWRAMVDAANARQRTKPIDVAYQFSNGRKFARSEDPYSWVDGGGSNPGVVDDDDFPFTFSDEGDGIGDFELS